VGPCTPCLWASWPWASPSWPQSLLFVVKAQGLQGAPLASMGFPAVTASSSRVSKGSPASRVRLAAHRPSLRL
jgi:hypothetical protein